MCLEGLVAKGATDLHAARRLACHICTDLFARGHLSLPPGESSGHGGARARDGAEERGSEEGPSGAEGCLWGVTALRHLLSIALSSHGGNTAARGGPEEKETWEGVRVRGVQEVALALVRLLRAAVQLLMLSEQEALALRERELERQREEMTEAASAHEDAAASKDASENAQFRSTVAVLPLMDSYAAPPRWAALRAGSIGHDSGGEGNRRHEPEMVEGVRVIDEVMKVLRRRCPRPLSMR